MRSTGFGLYSPHLPAVAAVDGRDGGEVAELQVRLGLEVSLSGSGDGGARGGGRAAAQADGFLVAAAGGAAARGRGGAGAGGRGGHGGGGEGRHGGVCCGVWGVTRASLVCATARASRC